METLEYVKNNFLGMSHENQMMILDTFTNTLNKTESKKILKAFNDTFLDYFQKINNLILFKEQYKSFNGDKRRLTIKIILEELIKQVDNHHINNSDEMRSAHFLYSSEQIIEQCKVEEYIRYFKPKSISSEAVKDFIVGYSKLSAINKMNLIDEMNSYYERLNYFSSPVSENTLQEYRTIIQNFIGDELIEYYDCLYSEEQMRLIMNIIHYFELFEYDENYYIQINSEMRKNPEFIRKLKKETIHHCSYKLNKSSIN